MKFSKLTKTNIFRTLVGVWASVANTETGNQAMQMLESVWDLFSMPSSDTRYKDAHGDIVQHFFNNSDWELDYLFIERLHVLDDTTDFKKFIEVMLAPEYHVDAELSRDKLRLVIEEYTDNIPLFLFFN